MRSSPEALALGSIVLRMGVRGEGTESLGGGRVVHLAGVGGPHEPFWWDSSS